MQRKDLLDRGVYAVRIADEIDQKYRDELASNKKPEERENLVFAISGKWGEGKSDLLDRLQPLLEDKKFEVVRFNPWQYTKDEKALRRAFLKAVDAKLGTGVDLSDLYFDKTQTKVNWNETFQLLMKVLFVAIIAYPFLGVYKVLLAETLKDKSLVDQIIKLTTYTLGLIATSFLLPTAVNAVSIDRSQAAINTAEEFEAKFQEILKNKKRIVIFIDDLDRCTQETVKVVLDSLKTFLKHPECSYVITGDHTVIEKYAANEVDEKGNLSEGRRFLKKLFDVYWKMPVPTPIKFEELISDELNKTKIDLDSTQSENIKRFLIDDDLFDRNPRQVKRFLTSLRFQIDTRKLQLTELESLDKKSPSSILKESINNLREIIGNPDVLAKIQSIEEFVFPMYQKLVLHPDLMIDHEKKVKKGEAIDLTIISAKDEEKAAMLIPYVTILKKEPLITDDDDFVKYNIGDFFYSSGTTGLPSLVGPDPTNFINNLKTGTLFQKAGELLRKGTKNEKNRELAQQALAAIGTSSDQEKNNIILECYKLSEQIPEWRELLPKWNSHFLTLPSDILENTSELVLKINLVYKPQEVEAFLQTKPELSKKLWEVVEKIDKGALTKESIELLGKLVDADLSRQPPDLLGLSVYSEKVSEDKITSLTSTIDSPDIAKTTFDALKVFTPLPNKVIDKVIDKTRVFFKNDPSFISWAIANIPTLEEMKILEEVKRSIADLSSKVEYTVDVVNAVQPLSLESALQTKVQQYIIKNIQNSASPTLLENDTVINFLPVTQRAGTFDSLAQKFLDPKEDGLLRNQLGDVLIKTKTFWNGVNKEDVYQGLRELSRKSMKSNVELNQKKKEILSSWGYDPILKKSAQTSANT